jgi:hypothetical protein
MQLRGFVFGVIAGISAAAISQEMRKPPEQRTWKGHIGAIPYNFRFDEWQGIAQEYWNPASEHLLTEHVIGVGWGVNFAALTRRAQDALSSARQSNNQKVIDAAPVNSQA